MTLNDDGNFGNRDDVSLVEDDTAIQGDGGDVLTIWKVDRKTMIDNVLGSNFTNNSSFGLPKAVVGDGNFARSWKDTEKFLGTNATGKALGADGRPLAGTAYFEIGDETFGKEVTGGFALSIKPPSPVEEGGVVAEQPVNFGFRPTMDGLDYYVEGTGSSHEAGVIQWGMIDGTITDYAGDPLESIPIFGQGAGTKTDEDGYYRIIAPGDVSVELAGVGYTKERTPAAGETLTVDWQFARLVIEVVTPSLEPMKGVPLQIGSESYTTDEKGKVAVDPAQVTAYDVTVSDRWEFTANIQEEGQLYTERFGDEGDKAGCDLRLVDADTGDPIRDLPGLFPNVDSWATSNRNGRLRIITDDADEDRLIIGETDNRYRNVEYPIELTAGETIAGRIEIDRNVQVSNR